MTAVIYRLWDYRRPEEASACETRLFLQELNKTIEKAIADEPPELVPYHGAGIDGMDLE